MAASAMQFFANNIDVEKLADLTANLRMLLTTSAYVPDTTNTGHTVLADVTDELPAGGGYATGGVALTSPAITAYSTTGFKLTTDDATWLASGSGIPAWRYGVLYYLGALWGLTSPLLAVFTGDDAPADIAASSSGTTLQIVCPADGWIRVRRT